jgi:hypothetical protein
MVIKNDCDFLENIYKDKIGVIKTKQALSPAFFYCYY